MLAILIKYNMKNKLSIRNIVIIFEWIPAKKICHGVFNYNILKRKAIVNSRTAWT